MTPTVPLIFDSATIRRRTAGCLTAELTFAAVKRQDGFAALRTRYRVELRREHDERVARHNSTGVGRGWWSVLSWAAAARTGDGD